MKNFQDFIFESASDYMKLLGLSAGFSSDELKIAYRKASSANHPDKGGDVALMQKINVAYDYLSKNIGSVSNKASFSMSDYEDRNQKYREAHDRVITTMVNQFDQNAYVKYFEGIFEKKFTAKVVPSVAKGNSSPFYAYLTTEFQSDDKEVSLKASISVSLIDVVHPKGALASESSFFDMHIFTEFFANNRKQTIEKRNYNSKNDSKLFTDPTIIFPEKKITKGKSNKSTKFSKKDMELALKTKLNAKDIGQGYFNIPLNDNLTLQLSRTVFMRQAAWTPSHVIYSGKRSSDRANMNYFSETEESLNKLIKVVHSLKNATTAEEVNRAFTMTFKNDV